MSERTIEYFKQFEGMEVETSIYRIKGKRLSAYAKAIGDMNPKYHPTIVEGEEKPDYSKVIAHPAYAATYTIPGLLKLADLKGDDGELMVKNVGKLLHTGQEYDFTGCDELKPEDKKVYSDGKLQRFWMKSGMLWIEVLVTSHNKENTKTFCRTKLTAAIREGGF